MSKMEKSRNHLEKALQLKGETRALALDIKRKTERKLSEIHADVKLTEVGKSEARLEAQELAAVEASRRALNLQQGVRANLAMAKKAAQEVVNRKVKKPSADQVERFQRELNRVKTSLMLEREGKKALDTLNRFVDSIPGPYEAQLVEDSFADLAGHVLALDPAAKLHLSRTFERVQTDFESEDVKEARAIIEQAERLESAKLFKPLEADAVREVTKEYFAVDLNQPERLYSTEEWKGMEPDPHPDLKRLEAEEKADQKMAKDDGELSIMDLWKFDENGKLVRREQ